MASKFDEKSDTKTDTVIFLPSHLVNRPLHRESGAAGIHGAWFDDNQDVAPCRPKAAEQSPEYSILDSQPSVRLFSLEYTQRFLTEGKNLKGKVVARTEESAEAAVDEKVKSWNGIYSIEAGSGTALIA